MLPPASTPCQRNTRSHPSAFVQSLAKEAEHYLRMALAQSTKKTYSFGTRQFFSLNINLKLPINEEALINFSVVMARSVQYTTICRQSKITILAMATSFLFLISFISNLFSEALSIHKGNCPKYSDQNFTTVEFILLPPQCAAY